jgi:phytoene dehydrogenase-like protein
MERVTIVGGGIAGLVAAISCAEAGCSVRLLEAHEEIGGRARASGGPFVANFGPHALYEGRANWRWLEERGILPPMARKYPSRKVRFHLGGRVRRTPPPALARTLSLRFRQAPADRDFRSWASSICGERAAAALSGWAGAFTFDPDPGRLSAQFVWERWRWIYAPTAVRPVLGGWGELIARLRSRAVELGVTIETGARVESLPEPPVIVATELDEARRLLGDPGLGWESPDAVVLDIGLRSRRRDPAAVLDLEGGALVERVSIVDRSLAPRGQDLIQAHVGIPSGAAAKVGVERIEAILDAAFPGWRERVTWRRRRLSRGRTGAVDLPGRTWRDRPAVDRGGGVFLAGDMVAAPGVLSEVSFESGQAAARLACAWSATKTRGA